MRSIKRDRYNRKIRDIEKRIASLSSEIRSLESLISNGAREKSTAHKLHPEKGSPEKRRRLASYLSTGSFHTIDLRRHERRAARIKRAVIVVVSLAIIFLIWVWLWG